MDDMSNDMDSGGVFAALLASVSGDSVVVPKRVVALVGDVTASLALVTLFSWVGTSDVTRVDRDGNVWVVPTDDEWWEAARLRGSELSRALSHLKTAGYIETKSFVLHPEPAADSKENSDLGGADNSSGAPDVGAGVHRQHIRVLWGPCAEMLVGGVDMQAPTSSPRRQSAKKKAGPVTLASLGFTPHDDDRERLEGSLRLAVMLAKLIGANTQKEPAVTKTWVAEVERMMRLDGYTEKQVENAILWSQSNDFWWKNIKSPQKLRRHFELLREQARRNPQQAKQLIEKSQLILEGKQRATGDTGDVFDVDSATTSFDESSEEELAKSWGMVWSDEQQRWVQPRPELP